MKYDTKKESSSLFAQLLVFSFFLALGLAPAAFAQSSEDTDTRSFDLGLRSPDRTGVEKAPIVLENLEAVQFKNASGFVDGAEIVRYRGNALRFRYVGNKAVFDALDDRPFEIRNSANIPIFRIAPSGLSYLTGNLGLGTSNPTESLEVIGNIKLSGDIVSNGDICIGSGCP